MTNPKTPAERQAAIDDFTIAYGTALGCWGTVENSLYILYLALCGYPITFPSPATVTYEALIHLDTKLLVIDALAEFRFSDNQPKLEEWSNLHNRIRRKVRNVRNKIAHWRVWRIEEEHQFSIFLGPPVHVPGTLDQNTGRSNTGAMQEKDLLEHARRFKELAEAIQIFAETLRPSPKKSPSAE